jgi:hypothetical protein
MKVNGAERAPGEVIVLKVRKVLVGDLKRHDQRETSGHRVHT